jgi:hypothetical protein
MTGSGATDLTWCALASDGARSGFDHRGIDWTTLQGHTTEQLRWRLDELHRWEVSAIRAAGPGDGPVVGAGRVSR